MEKTDEIERLRRSDEILRTTILQIGEQSGLPYLQSLVNSLGAAFDSKLAFVGQLSPEDPTKVLVLAHWERDEHLLPQDLIYDLTDTPCEQIACNCLAIYRDDVQEMFPKDEMLREFGYVSYAGAPLTNSRGEVIGLLSLLNDKPFDDIELITSMLKLFASGAGKELERKTAESNLQENEHRLQLIVDLTSDVVWDWDIVNDTISYSDRIYETLGYTVEEMGSQRMTIYSLMHPEDLPEHLAWLDGYLKGSEGGEFSFDLRLQARDGRYRWIHSSGTLIRDEKGEPKRMLGAFTDVSESKEAEVERERLISELEFKNSELERFTYTVSHELRSPLVTLSGFVGILKEDIERKEAEAVKQDCHEIMQAVRKMGTLLDNLLELSRVGRVLDPHEIVPLHELVQESMSLLDARIKNAGIQINIKDALPTISGDRVRWQQVFQNLLENAVKYRCSQNPSIEIGVITGRDRPPTIFVKDNGIGIDPKFHQRVFGLFEKLDPRTEGTGVGLALVQRIIQLQGGRIWLDSPGPGQGCTFYIELPAVEPQPIETV
ncbi:GAF domain-containing sensor histidine kinase [Blastopirellula marina]|uniref:histidine kinase n=1 Tax=Blastopirellula marina DSM 3645 TaxID=314230 RepID=A3ZRU1_9BACT|nr:ATP-binding protein [Blastopirellula marina]EAQ80860.1 sensory box histidine kinase [Blastopirellula marina DSM 3645]